MSPSERPAQMAKLSGEAPALCFPLRRTLQAELAKRAMQFWLTTDALVMLAILLIQSTPQHLPDLGIKPHRSLGASCIGFGISPLSLPLPIIGNRGLNHLCTVYDCRRRFGTAARSHAYETDARLWAMAQICYFEPLLGLTIGPAQPEPVAPHAPLCVRILALE